MIGQVVLPTNQIYLPLVEEHSQEIEGASRDTYSYGSDARQQLDIYTPSSAAPTLGGNSRPVLVFFYGGGFANGDKVNPMRPLFYKNLGYFFAEKVGLETIIVDYRLIKHGASFPSGGDDVDAALSWIDQRYAGQKRALYLMGNSAGGINVCTWLFEPTYLQSRRKLIAGGGSTGVKLAGVIVLGALYHFQNSSAPLREALGGYFGEGLDDKSPIASIQRAEEAGELTSAEWPPVLVMDCELDPEDIQKSSQDFVALLKKAGTFQLDYVNIKGHNHISPPLGLGSGIEAEEEWGYKLGSWLKKDPA
ncbi:uncharacterized protein Z520_00764 [Fonsecaea multimorphosa CBS 102226]|uniref:BD-FAE-like domain-containing protein n=1 Tax=Fonsecaea multimorphosa CBS 102226 TaxID=1442371 RepID=A0A0D2J3U8_9EURO|nr:uncharacterized protein Z520_00764 [Fonsecaea multimorphosa CBS 102226]KIY04072.1 hypothetical protein Z520_00764 [Fonsecaea multimorphosa CBS 102226]OAL31907.1 hypothetical protein AYO22_00777 [Fonsecaea multimorphosa]